MFVMGISRMETQDQKPVHIRAARQKRLTRTATITGIEISIYGYSIGSDGHKWKKPYSSIVCRLLIYRFRLYSICQFAKWII